MQTQCSKKGGSMSDDPRLGLPSASGIERVLECPGSFALCRILPEWEKESEYAEKGTLLHKGVEAIFLGEPMPEGLEPEDLEHLDEIVEQAWDACKKVFDLIESDRTDDPSKWPVEIFTEQRAWIRDADLKKVASGQLDLLFIRDEKALELDAKTGWLETTPSEKNWQLITNLIALAEQRDGIVEFFAGILQPNKMRAPDLATYPLSFLDIKRRRLMEGVRVAHEAEPYRLALNPDAERWCKYCPARKDCPALQYSHGLIKKNSPTIPAALDKAMTLIRKEDLPDWLDRGKETELLIQGLKDYAKELLNEDPESVQGWELKPGNNLRNIEDVKAAYVIFKEEYDVTPGEFLAFVKITMGGLEQLHKDKSGLKGKKAKDDFNNLMEPILSYKQNKPSLTKTT